jgi:hypothetical protein
LATKRGPKDGSTITDTVELQLKNRRSAVGGSQFAAFVGWATAAVRLSEWLARLREFAYLNVTRPGGPWRHYCTAHAAVRSNAALVHRKRDGHEQVSAKEKPSTGKVDG